MRARGCDAELPVVVVHTAALGEHVTDGRECWCRPQVLRLLSRVRFARAR